MKWYYMILLLLYIYICMYTYLYICIYGHKCLWRTPKPGSTRHPRLLILGPSPSQDVPGHSRRSMRSVQGTGGRSLRDWRAKEVVNPKPKTISSNQAVWWPWDSSSQLLQGNTHQVYGGNRWIRNIHRKCHGVYGVLIGNHMILYGFLGKSWDNKNQEVKNHKHKFHGFDETS